MDNIISGGGTANFCSIDFSKAFDKVNHNALFLKLMVRQLQYKLSKVIESLLSNCLSTVKWFDVYSSYFETDFGVRQGSVLSPSLFVIYINDIIPKGMFDWNSVLILYADDILLVTQSICYLQKLLSICESELNWLDMCIIIQKSSFLRVGPRHNAQCSNLVTSSGIALRWVQEFRYLGCYIISARNFKCSTSHNKSLFYSAAKAIIGRVGCVASEEVFTHLLNSKCVSILLYGLECFSINRSDSNSLDITLRQVFMKLFKTSAVDIINFYMSQFDVQLPSVLLEARAQKLNRKYAASANKLCYLLSLIGT